MESLSFGHNMRVYYGHDIDAKSLEYLQELSRAQISEMLDDANSAKAGRYVDFEDRDRNRLRLARKSGKYILTNRR